LPGATSEAAALRTAGSVVAVPDEAAALAGVTSAPVAPLVALEARAESAVVLESAVSVWLIEINCSRLFTFTSWLMYSLGSTSAVGSWFCISVTSRVRKSLAEMEAESLVELLVPLVALGLVAATAGGVAALPVRV
jgi:hypothetical protein